MKVSSIFTHHHKASIAYISVKKKNVQINANQEYWSEQEWG